MRLQRLAARLLPLRCAVCALQPAEPQALVCAACEADFFSATRIRCERCAIGLPSGARDDQRICGRCLADAPHFDATTTLADYVSPVDGMIVALKFTARLDLATLFGKLLARRLAPDFSRDAIVLPVPLSFERVRQRGFNQAHHIARAFTSVMSLPLMLNCLLRIKDTPPQQSLELKERRRNVRDAFAAEGDVKGRPVFVVDDVMTTGSTLDEIAKTLKRAGAVRVHNLIVARTP